MAELKPMEVIMRIDFVASDGEQICAHAEKVQELIRCRDCIHCADDWNGNQPMFTCELARCGESVYPNDYCSRAERRNDG